LEIHYTSPELAAADDVNRTELLIFVGHGALVLLLMLVCLQLWVLRPVAKIASSLRSRDASELQPLLGRSDETGGMARVVVDHFEDQTALKRNEQILADALEERIRLGRDLHDGVIQSLFAAGMSLSSTRDLIRQDPARAERAVDEMRDRLNDIIRDVRAFIVGMEPEFLRQKTFAEAVHALIEALCHVRLISVKTDLPEALGEKLSGDQKIHALQLIRELLLHCLRHDHTTALSLALSTAPDGLTLSFQGGDDGFEGGNSQISNTGIATIAARARASRVRCDVFTSSGQAARVAVRYPPAPSTSNP
jgi:signal transduction histidine kinase